MSENDSVNLFLDCIERTLNVHEAAEDDNDEEKDHVQDSKVKQDLKADSKPMSAKSIDKNAKKVESQPI